VGLLGGGNQAGTECADQPIEQRQCQEEREEQK